MHIPLFNDHEDVIANKKEGDVKGYNRFLIYSKKVRNNILLLDVITKNPLPNFKFETHY